MTRKFPRSILWKWGLSATLQEKEIENVTLKTEYFPAWTTDMLTATAKEKLQNYGIAPPRHIVQNELVQITLPQKITCPYCLSEKTKLKSAFSSTSCKALYFCENCIQPFEHFKEI
jgi:ring-1,2-phenylacetyl-CoA epoxidase subunit PaaD